MLYADLRDKLPKTCTICWIADLHVGRVDLKEDLIRKEVQKIEQNPDWFVGLGGDLIEAIAVGDKRFSLEEHGGKHAVANAQVDFCVELLNPIKDRILFVLTGNHEDTIAPVYRATDDLCLKLGIKETVAHGNFDAVAHLTDNDKYPVKWYAHHGAGSIRSQAGDRDQIYRNDARKVKRKLRNIRSDCILMSIAHIHKTRICFPPKLMGMVGTTERPVKQAYPEVMIDPDTGYISEDSRTYFSTGAWWGGQVINKDTYGSKKMFDPLELGYNRIRIEDGYIKSVEDIIVG